MTQIFIDPWTQVRALVKRHLQGVFRYNEVPGKPEYYTLNSYDAGYCLDRPDRGSKQMFIEVEKL